MAYALTKRGSQDNVITYEFICDTAADLAKIETEYRTLGSIAIILQGEGDSMEVYICGSDHQWKSLTTISTGGSTEIDLSDYVTTSALQTALGDYAPKQSPEFTNSISFNRMPESTIGTDSIALGLTGGAATASGTGAIALGGSTASALQSFAAGPGATASSYSASAIGFHTVASNQYAHATGSRTTASGVASMAGGQYTIANHAAQYALGQYNVSDTSNAEADARGTYIEIIGNGNGADARSNARVLDWAGNEYIGGDIYVGCDSSSAHGTKLARIPAPPSTDGTYTLQATVSSGTITYTWVAGA